MINKFQEGGQVQAQQQQILMQAAQVLQSAGYNITDGQGNLNQQAFIQAVAQYGQEKLGVQVTQQNIGQVIATIAQQGAQMARKGAKLNYLKKITGQCPEGTQLTYYKAGGQICSKCEAIAKKEEQSGIMGTIKKQLMKEGGKTVKKKLDLAARDSIQVNKYNDQTIQTTRPGKYKSTKDGETTWVPDRTKAPYNKKAEEKKEKGGEIKAKICSKCGKVHVGKCGSKLTKKKKKCACGTKIDVKKCGAKMKKKHQFGGILTAMQKLQDGGSLKGSPFLH